MPTELRQAQYYIWYREFAGETPNSKDSSKSIKVIKANNYTIENLSPSTAYVVCVQMAGQPCFEMISFSHCVDVNTMGTSESINSLSMKNYMPKTCFNNFTRLNLSFLIVTSLLACRQALQGRQ